MKANRSKLMLLGSLLFMFFFGGVAGAFGFKLIGYSATIPLAVFLLVLAFMPVVDDLKRIFY